MRTRLHSAAAALAVIAALLPTTPASGAPLGDVVRADLERARDRLAASANSVPVDRYPVRTDDAGGWETSGPGSWTSGFFPSTLWLGYAATGDARLRAEAEARLTGLESQKRDRSGNDQGFKLLGSFGRGYELTGRERYRRTAVRGAASLASRFSPVVGATRSWGDRGSPAFTVIVDNLMNLELLFWGARHGGDPAWHGIALSHALRTMREHVRNDGSTFHVVDFDPDSGRVWRKRTRQGLGRDSTWSRGQAWAVYGFTVAYRETHDARMLTAARRTADWFVAHLPADRVPYWDFDAPQISDGPRDSSAAAIAVSGLLELTTLDPEPARTARYRAAAEAILASLSSEAYLADGSSQAILLHGTQDLPGGSFDTGLSFGDHYFVEALVRYLSPPRQLAGPSVGIQSGSIRMERRRLRATVEAEVPGRVRVAVIPGRRTARRLGLRTARSGVLGRAATQVEAAARTTVRIPLRRRAVAALRTPGGARLTLSATFAAPDVGTSATSVTVRLEPPLD